MTIEMADQLSFDAVEGSGLAAARRLAELHQLLYMRGGIRPVNAAIEELSKLLLLRIAQRRLPELRIESFGSLTEILDADRIAASDSVKAVKAAFSAVVRSEHFSGRLPDGSLQPVWPPDEPLRIARADILAEALRVLEHIEVSTDARLDPLGTAFDVFLQGKYDHAGGLGTYLTPQPIARLMARVALSLIDPIGTLEQITFGHPGCVTGRFPVMVIEQLRLYQANIGVLEQFAESGIFGSDQSASAVAKARVNLMSYGIRTPHVFTVQDSIVDPQLDNMEGTLRLILTNPPFGDAKYDSREGIWRTARVFTDLGERDRIDPALAFTARCLKLLDEGGVLGIVLPNGLLDGRTLRNALVRHNEITVEANISLPTATFALAGTVAKTSALFVRKGPSRHKTVFLARSDHVGYLKKAGGAVPDPDGSDTGLIAELASVLRDGRTQRPRTLSIEPLVALVTREDLTSFDPSQVDPSALSARAELRSMKGRRLSELVAPVGKRREVLRPSAPFVSVLHVDEMSCVDWISAEAYRPTTPGVVAYRGELIVSLLNPSKLRATVVPDQYDAIYCSAEFGVFRTECDPYGVLSVLRDSRVRSQLAPLGRGTSSSRRRIEPKDVCDLVIPPVDREWLADEGARVRNAMTEFDRARRALAEAFRAYS